MPWMRHKLPPGPWDNEPNSARWSYLGYDCLILRQPYLGTLNGYVGIPRSHPLYGEKYMDALSNYLSVHGGVTYADTMNDRDLDDIPEIGTFGDEWYIGFDTCHARDIVPAWEEYNEIMSIGKALGFVYQYRDFEYVKGMVEALAQQLFLLEGKNNTA